MREIKFRAWTPLGMKLVDTIWFFEEEIDCEIDTKQPSHFNFKDIELMQYTGLKDVNGVEIYEGDIIKSPSKYFKNITNEYEVVYLTLGFALKRINRKDTKLNGTIDIFMEPWENCEVTGNIYER